MRERRFHLCLGEDRREKAVRFEKSTAHIARKADLARHNLLKLYQILHLSREFFDLLLKFAYKLMKIRPYQKAHKRKDKSND